jgi:hypothetical protein
MNSLIRISALARIGLCTVGGLIPSMAGAQTQAGTVSGNVHHSRVLRVFDETSGDPISGVHIVEAVTGMSAVTMSTGQVNIRDLPDGRPTLTLQKIGYQAITVTLTIGSADTVPVSVKMSRLTNLPGVGASAASMTQRMRGFEERRASGHGAFITDSTLRENENTRVSSLLAGRIPSVSVKSVGSRTQVVSNRLVMNGHACPVDIYLDGAVVYTNAGPGGDESTALGDTNVTKMIKGSVSLSNAAQAADQTASDINQFLARDLSGIEYHDVSDMPIGFSHTSGGCGALFLWTRPR